MKKLIKYLVVAMVFILTMVSFTSNNTCSACSERLTYKIQGTLSDRGSANINVSGNYIDVRWDVANVYTGGTVDVYIRDNSGNDKILKNGRNQVSPGSYFLHMDWVSILSADVTVTFECGSNAGTSNAGTSNAGASHRSNNNSEIYNPNKQRSTPTRESDGLSGLWPSENIIREALRNFHFNDDVNTSIDEAKRMLQYIGAEKISLLTSTYVSGIFQSGAEITIWPNTYDKQSCYGIRYGRPLSGRPYFGSNDTYFEICK